MTDIAASVCIAGGGPARLMAGYFLMHAGIDVMVLEKHADFLHDFRGDTIHPSTLRMMQEQGFLEKFLCLPHQKAFTASARIGNEKFTVAADIGRIFIRCPDRATLPR